MVKEGHLATYPNKTIGSAVDSFFGSPKWEAGVSESGTHFVNVSGKIMFMEKEVTAKLQFEVKPDAGTFNVNALEFNEIPQNQFVIAALLMKMFQ